MVGLAGVPRRARQQGGSLRASPPTRTRSSASRMINIVVKAAEMLNFVDTPKRLVVPHARRASASSRRRLPGAQGHLAPSSSSSCGSSKEVVAMIERGGEGAVSAPASSPWIHPADQAHESLRAAFDTLIHWARFGDLFSYDVEGVGDAADAVAGGGGGGEKKKRSGRRKGATWSRGNVRHRRAPSIEADRRLRVRPPRHPRACARAPPPVTVAHTRPRGRGADARRERARSGAAQPSARAGGVTVVDELCHPPRASSRRRSARPRPAELVALVHHLAAGERSGARAEGRGSRWSVCSSPPPGAPW